MKVDLLQIPDVIEKMKDWIKTKQSGRYIVISNANDVVMSRKDESIARAVNDSDLSVPDGISLVLSARLFGYKLKKRVYGPDLMFEFIQKTVDDNYAHFLYGSTTQTLDALSCKLKQQFPGIKITGMYSPPFRELTENEDKDIVDIINNSGADILWVGLGCPKQQIWMYEHKDKINVPVMVGVGAAFDFLSGVKIQAPRWIRDNGFEWLFCLVTEPKRLWKRYIVGNTIFLSILLGEFFNSSRKNKFNT